MNNLIITVDLDWACEFAVEETLNFLINNKIPPTIFITHRSAVVEANINQIEVGLHPYFAKDSSHGSTIDEVIKYVMDLPHNLPAFRCHRFAICNASRQAMLEAGMLISSNVCTDLEIIPPFTDRVGLLEVPIFLEDGGYLWRNHSLEYNQGLEMKLKQHGTKVLLIHPMHFALNTPNFSYMYDIKQSVSREEWNNMNKKTIDKLRWRGRGIRDLLMDILRSNQSYQSLGSLLAAR
ncbi:MAG: hypothetical protein K0Q51_1463 [Rickettsiaceae bacterium]|jgi:hypothetical protein|nr:hypothetical protein [Rickettsiaceae bacterium]